MCGDSVGVLWSREGAGGDDVKVRSKHSMRHSANKRYLSKLLQFQGHRCYWCSRPIVRPRSIYSESYITADYRVIWFDEQLLVRSCLMATIDHLKPLVVDGTNAPENLVASCQPCNGARTPGECAPPVPKSEMCRRCGARMGFCGRICGECIAAEEQDNLKPKVLWQASLMGRISVPADILARFGIEEPPA